MPENRIENIVFDLGGVLVDWNPKYLYNKIFSEDKKKVDWFLSTVCTNEWNVEQDAGHPLGAAGSQPVEDPGKQAENRSRHQHVMEMGDHVIGIVKVIVDTAIGQHDTRHTTNGEERDHAQRPDHRCTELNGSAPHGRDPAKELDPGRHSYEQGREHERHPQEALHSGGKHVVGPHQEPDDRDGHGRHGHEAVAEDPLAREAGDELRDDPHRRQDHDVDRRMGVEPEEVLEEDRVAPQGGIENADVQQALARADDGGRLALVVLGANWCHDSRALASRLNRPPLAALIQQEYELVFVDVGFLDKGREVVQQFGVPQFYATPTLLIIDPSSGTLINDEDRHMWANAYSIDMPSSVQYFEKWATTEPVPDPAAAASHSTCMTATP